MLEYDYFNYSTQKYFTQHEWILLDRRAFEHFMNRLAGKNNCDSERNETEMVKENLTF
jgi:hypothetical protein